MPLMTIILFFTVASALSCDPQTQYERQDGQCCKKCGPGTRMSEPGGNCLDPLCKACAKDEFQPGYTVHIRCDLQPYCDPNKNFVPDGAVSTERQSVCTCKDGYHCSSEACITCVAHSHCAPGQGVQDKGNHAHDTVCQDCPPNTFSTKESADSDCQNWTICEPGSQTKTGTATSDTVCEKMRSNIIVIIPVILVTLLVLFICWKCRGNATNAKEKQGFVELGPDEAADGPSNTRAEPRAGRHMLIHHPQEVSLPEENEDQFVYAQQPMSAIGTPPVTESGKVMVQEWGKGPVVSRQESQESPLFLRTI